MDDLLERVVVLRVTHDQYRRAQDSGRLISVSQAGMVWDAKRLEWVRVEFKD